MGNIEGGGIVTERLATLLESDLRSPWLESFGITEARLIASAGMYSRAPPIFMDTKRAEATTREQVSTYTRTLLQQYGPLHCAVLRDALVLGQGAVITRNSVLLWESAAEFLAHGLTPDGLRQVSIDRWQINHRPTLRVDEPCLLVKRPWFRNFGHWLIDCATLLSLLGDDVRRFGLTIVTGVYDDPAMHRIVSETLELLAPGIPILQQPDHEVWQFTNLHYAMPVHVPPLFKLPAAIQRLRTLVLKASNCQRHSTSPRRRRIYISRPAAATRCVVNESDLTYLLSHLGFETLQLSGWSLSEQALLFSEADVIVGVKGAALANIVFCRPSCSVIVLSPADFPDPFFWDIAGQLELRYGELFCSATTYLPPGRNDFIVDPIAVARMLGAVMMPAALSGG